MRSLKIHFINEAFDHGRPENLFDKIEEKVNTLEEQGATCEVQFPPGVKGALILAWTDLSKPKRKP
jgi:hypothetical protein